MKKVKYTDIAFMSELAQDLGFTDLVFTEDEDPANEHGDDWRLAVLVAVDSFLDQRFMEGESLAKKYSHHLCDYCKMLHTTESCPNR